MEWYELLRHENVLEYTMLKDKDWNSFWCEKLIQGPTHAKGKVGQCKSSGWKRNKNAFGENLDVSEPKMNIKVVKSIEE